MTRLETFANLGFRKDPFKDAAFETGDGLRVRRILSMAVESRAMVSICGERGIGKTKAITAALEKLGVRRVTVTRGQKEKISIGDIESALVLDLASGESPRRSGEARSRQVRRIVGEVSRKEKVVLLIEEAHRLHSATLRSLKTLREIQWMGESELFTVVLVGQSDPLSRPGVSEVALRTDCVRMHGLSTDESVGYVRAVLGSYFDESGLDAMAELPQAKNYLELQGLVLELLNIVLADGRTLVTAADVQALNGQQQTPLPRGKVKKSAVTASPKDALGAVLGRRSPDTQTAEAV